MKKSILTLVYQILTTLLLLSLVNCSEKEEKKELSLQNSQFITHGEKVQEQDLIAKSTVNLYLTFQDGKKITHFDNVCTGVLINSRYILTAAHCLVDVATELKLSMDQLAQSYKIGFGTHIVQSSVNSAVIFRDVESVKAHEKYTIDSIQVAETEPMYDIGILKLKEDAPEGYINVKMEQNKDALTAGMEVVLAGYGLLNASPWFPTYATQLMKVTVNVDNPKLTDSQFTYKAIQLKGSCSGDSGGPAYVVNSDSSLTLVGVTSWGDSYCTKMGAYTSVPYFYDWIQNQITQQQITPPEL